MAEADTDADTRMKIPDTPDQTGQSAIELTHLTADRLGPGVERGARFKDDRGAPRSTIWMLILRLLLAVRAKTCTRSKS